MANTADKLRALAWTAFQETLRRKVFYIVVLLVLIVAVSIASQVVTVTMATEAGETAMVSQIHTESIEEIFGMWDFATTFLAIYLGAVAISSEMSGKTLANVLSRPVERWTYMTGRWLGTLSFLWIFELSGLAIAIAAVRTFGVQHTPTVWLGCVERLVRVALFSGISMGLSVAMPSVLAGGIALLIPLLPGMVGDILNHPRWIVRALAEVGYYIAPATMPADLITESFRKGVVHPPYAFYGQVLTENFLYAIAFFAIACVVFSRREIRLR